MPSAFAHGLVGATFAMALPRALRRPWVAILMAILAAAPDLDVLALHLGIPYAHPLGHRGITHSLVFAGALALLTLPLWRVRFRDRTGTAAVVTFLVLASHGLLDTLTDAGHGIGLLLPFDGERYFAPWRPIRTSPLSVSAFFTQSGLDVLRSEVLWIGIPCLGALAALGSFRLRAARRSAAERVGAG